MEVVYNVLKFIHVMGFVFMSTPFLAFIIIGVGALFTRKVNRTPFVLDGFEDFLK